MGRVGQQPPGAYYTLAAAARQRLVVERAEFGRLMMNRRRDRDYRRIDPRLGGRVSRNQQRGDAVRIYNREHHSIVGIRSGLLLLGGKLNY
jgi:hypothetical protein